MKPQITDDQLFGARDAAIQAHDSAWRAMSNWSMGYVDTLEDDLTALKDARNRLFEALQPGLLEFIERCVCSELAAVILEGHTFATAHEAARRAIRLALLAADNVAEGERFPIWEPELMTELVARVKREWAITVECQGDDSKDVISDDKKTAASRRTNCAPAHQIKKLFPNGDVDPILTEVIVYIDTHRSSGKSYNELIQEKLGYSKDEAKKTEKSIRSLRSKKLTTLPPQS